MRYRHGRGFASEAELVVHNQYESASRRQPETALLNDSVRLLNASNETSFTAAKGSLGCMDNSEFAVSER